MYASTVPLGIFCSSAVNLPRAESIKIVLKIPPQVTAGFFWKNLMQ